ncbi:hypothetical protein JCM16303_006690 [Sporobolomyces ruberrimus]
MISRFLNRSSGPDAAPVEQHLSGEYEGQISVTISAIRVAEDLQLATSSLAWSRAKAWSATITVQEAGTRLSGAISVVDSDLPGNRKRFMSRPELGSRRLDLFGEICTKLQDLRFTSDASSFRQSGFATKKQISKYMSKAARYA